MLKAAITILSFLASASMASAGSLNYFVTNLVSDQPGMAQITDPSLVNAWGISASATQHALTKKDMKPSLMPFSFTKSSWYLARSAITADMSTSLNVVRSAAARWTATSRSAIFWRRGDILRRVCLAGCGDAVPDAEAFAKEGSPPAFASGFAEGVPAAASMSPFVTRPALPLPATAAGSTPVSAAMRWTAGD